MKLCISFSARFYLHPRLDPPYSELPLPTRSSAPTSLSSPLLARSPSSRSKFNRFSVCISGFDAPHSGINQRPLIRTVNCLDSSDSVTAAAPTSDYVDGDELRVIAAENFGNAENTHDLEDFKSDVSALVEKTGRNKRRISAYVCIEAPLDVVWQVLTDYEGLSDFIPSLVACQLLERREGGARLLQIGEQDIAFGFKFRAKGVLDVQENPVQISPTSVCREILFEMVEGDFQVFQGSWHLKQVNTNSSNDQTILSYILDVQPKIWLPVSAVENLLAKQLKVNLSSVRDKALSVFGSLHV